MKDLVRMRRYMDTPFCWYDPSEQMFGVRSPEANNRELWLKKWSDKLCTFHFRQNTTDPCVGLYIAKFPEFLVASRDGLARFGDGSVELVQALNLFRQSDLYNSMLLSQWLDEALRWIRREEAAGRSRYVTKAVQQYMGVS